VADDFYTGAGHMWEVGLKRFGEGHPLTFILEIEGLSKETPLFLEEWPTDRNCHFGIFAVLG
jgi:hypothetical protein